MTSYPFSPTRRRLAAAIALPALGLGTWGTGRAQSYPSRPVKLVVGYTPGGAGDALARLMAQKYSEAFGQSVIVENKPGAGATLAASAVATAAPDGYTLLVNTPPDSIVAFLTRGDQIRYTMNNFAPIGLVVTVPTVLVVLASSPYQTVDNLIKDAKAKPGTLNYASFGTGSSAHMAAELLKSVAGIDVTQIPFKGSSQAMMELLGGRIDFMFDTFASAWPQIQAGKLRALGTTGATRVPLAPNIPTMEELGLRGCVWQSFIGILAPAQTPATVLERLQSETARINAMPDVSQRLIAQGFVPSALLGKQYGAFLASETERTQKLIRDANLKLE